MLPCRVSEKALKKIREPVLRCEYPGIEIKPLGPRMLVKDKEGEPYWRFQCHLTGLIPRGSNASVELVAEAAEAEGDAGQLEALQEARHALGLQPGAPSRLVVQPPTVTVRSKDTITELKIVLADVDGNRVSKVPDQWKQAVVTMPGRAMLAPPEQQPEGPEHEGHGIAALAAAAAIEAASAPHTGSAGSWLQIGRGTDQKLNLTSTGSVSLKALTIKAQIHGLHLLTVSASAQGQRLQGQVRIEVTPANMVTRVRVLGTRNGRLHEDGNKFRAKPMSSLGTLVALVETADGQGLPLDVARRGLKIHIRCAERHGSGTGAPADPDNTFPPFLSRPVEVKERYPVTAEELAAWSAKSKQKDVVLTVQGPWVSNPGRRLPKKTRAAEEEEENEEEEEAPVAAAAAAAAAGEDPNQCYHAFSFELKKEHLERAGVLSLEGHFTEPREEIRHLKGKGSCGPLVDSDKVNITVAATMPKPEKRPGEKKIRVALSPLKHLAKVVTNEGDSRVLLLGARIRVTDRYGNPIEKPEKAEMSSSFRPCVIRVSLGPREGGEGLPQDFEMPQLEPLAGGAVEFRTDESGSVEIGDLIIRQGSGRLQAGSGSSPTIPLELVLEAWVSQRGRAGLLPWAGDR